MTMGLLVGAYNGLYIALHLTFESSSRHNCSIDLSDIRGQADFLIWLMECLWKTLTDRFTIANSPHRINQRVKSIIYAVMIVFNQNAFPINRGWGNVLRGRRRWALCWTNTTYLWRGVTRPTPTPSRASTATRGRQCPRGTRWDN